MPTALHRNSKSDTVLLLDAAAAALDVDLGPDRTDLADQTTYLEEAPSARSAVDAPRSLTIKLAMKSSWSGVVLELGRGGGAYSYQIRLLASAITFAEEGLLRASVVVPDLAGDSATILIHWAQRIEGANVVDEIAVGNLTSGAWSFATSTHAGLAPVATDTLTVAAGFGGGTPYTGGAAEIIGVHIGRRCRATVEAWEDWGTASTAPAFDGYDRTPTLTGPASELLIAGEGNFTGPSLLWAGAATRQAAQRCVGPFVNLSLRSPMLERIPAAPAHFHRATPDAWGQMSIRYLWHGYHGLKVNVAQVRAHVRALDVGGGGKISPVSLRVYSIAGLPVNGGAGPMTWHRSPAVTITAVSAAGVWLDLGVVRLARDDAGLSYLALGFRVDLDVDEGEEFSTAWMLNAITADPFAMDLSGGGMGGDMDKESP